LNPDVSHIRERRKRRTVLSDDEVPRKELDLSEDPELISPPIVAEPLYQCATAITVLGFISHAEIEIEVDSAVVLTRIADFPQPSGQSFPLPNPLVAGEIVRARQRIGGVESDWSTPIAVRDHTQDYPAGPPRPQINPGPIHKCGARTGVANLLIGCNVWIRADNTEVGRVKGAKEHQGVNVNPDYALGQKVRAWSELCDDPSPPSVLHTTQPPPTPIPTPSIETVHEGGEQITIKGLANGARFTITRGGVNQGTWRTWGQRHIVGLSPPFSNGEVISISQRLCPSDPASPEGYTTVQPCSSLPAPVVAPIQEGDTSITLIQFVPDARIKVYVNGVKVGDSGGSVIPLTQQIRYGDIIYVLQILGHCIGSTVREINAKCVSPPVTYDPSALDLFPVGHSNYKGGTTSVDETTYSIKGTVYYPAEDDGEKKPFNERLTGLGRVPIVFMAHGNHSIYYNPNDRNEEQCWNPNGWLEIPNHEGYDYFQRQLARMGIIAVSVYSNETNCTSYSATNMRHRAELIISSIAHFQKLDSNGDPIFGGRVDFSKVGLMGHSRGGEAVVVVPEIITLAGVTIKSVISLAPTDAGASSGAPSGYAFMTILPAGDGDVISNDGAKFYDKAQPYPFKSQLYVHKTNHNFFNRQWPKDDGHGPPVMPRFEHERILSAYGCAFFRATLLGHNTIRFLTDEMLPSGVATQNIHLSFELEGQVTVDDHEDRNGIGINSLGQPTAQLSGLTADEYTFAQTTATTTYNKTFFGNTIGMVTECLESMGRFRSQLSGNTDLSDREIWIRAAEVYNGSSVPSNPTGFELGLEDSEGVVGWIDSDSVGGLPRPYDRRSDDLARFPDDYTKSMLKTLRFKVRCSLAAKSNLDMTNIRAILLRCNRGDGRALAFDNLQIVSK